MLSASVTYKKITPIQTLQSTKKNEIKLIVDKDITPQVSSAGGKSWIGMSYGNGRFVTVNSSDSNKGISSDGKSWNEGSRGYANTCIDYYEKDSKFYAASSGGSIYRSEDGISWSSFATAPIGNITRIVCGEGCVVVMNRSRQTAAYDRDTKIWSTGTLPKDCCAICYGSGKFIAIQSASGSSASNVYSSTNGTTWSVLGSGTFGNSGFIGNVCYGNGKFATVASNGYMTYSTNGGSSWSKAQNLVSVETGFTDICYGGGEFYAIKDSNIMCISEDYISTTTPNSYITLGASAKREITGRTELTISSSSLTQAGDIYRIDVITERTKQIKATTVYDLIDFNNSSLLSKKNVIRATFDGSRVGSFYTLGSSGSGNIATEHRGSIELTVVPSLSASEGKIKINSYGEEKEEQNILSQTRIRIEKTDMVNRLGTYYADITGKDIILLKAIYIILNQH